MALPTTPNTTCDIYRNGVVPPSPPAVSAVSCHLRGQFADGIRAVTETNMTTRVMYTHVLLLESTVDIRDAYAGDVVFNAGDIVFIPNSSGNSFRVLFVERVHLGTPYEHKRVYLDRLAPPWPTHHV